MTSPWSARSGFEPLAQLTSCAAPADGLPATVGTWYGLGGTAPLSCGGTIPNANPRLGPLQNNGGPTPTHALLPGSLAIEAGTNAGCPATDQRGVSRPQGVACDIGAFESAFRLLFLPLVVR